MISENLPIIADQMSLFLLIAGVILSISGVLFRNSRIAVLDQKIIVSINRKLSPYNGLFNFLWPLGTTPVAIVFICMTFSLGKKTGLPGLLVFLAIMLVERMIKFSYKRDRPFNALPKIKMNQLWQPVDPSFPSGDAMRLWFLALVIPFAFGANWLVLVASLLFALILCFGRIALGVHYPLDVIGGLGLGSIGASVVIFIIHFQLIIE